MWLTRKKKSYIATSSFFPFLTPSMATLILAPSLDADITLVSSLNSSPCFLRILWKFLDTSISIPIPPTWPRNSMHVTWAPSLCHTEPWGGRECIGIETNNQLYDHIETETDIYMQKDIKTHNQMLFKSTKSIFYTSDLKFDLKILRCFVHDTYCITIKELNWVSD